MKALTCEMCGSTNLIKEDGVFVCQSCGTKYSVEEARKMMVEGTVSVKGMVSIDNSASIDNYLMMAKNALQSGNNTEAESYCNKIIEIQPTHSEAWGLKGTAAGWLSTLANIRLEESVSCYEKALEFADNADAMKQYVAEQFSNLCLAVIQLACNHFAEYPDSDVYATIDDKTLWIEATANQLLKDNEEGVRSLMAHIFSIIEDAAVGTYKVVKGKYNQELYPSEYDFKDFVAGGDGCLWLYRTLVGMNIACSDDKIRCYKAMIQIHKDLIKSCSYTIGDGGEYVQEFTLNTQAVALRNEDIMSCHKSIKELDENYVIPTTSNVSAPTGGCYIATAVYGSYDCPSVWTLRRFRDYTLAKSLFGRTFVKIYYAVSPTLVKWFGHSTIFKKMWKMPLDKLVATLNDRGVKNTPYEDRVW